MEALTEGGRSPPRAANRRDDLRQAFMKRRQMRAGAGPLDTLDAGSSLKSGRSICRVGFLIATCRRSRTKIRKREQARSRSPKSRFRGRNEVGSNGAVKRLNRARGRKRRQPSPFLKSPRSSPEQPALPPDLIRGEAKGPLSLRQRRVRSGTSCAAAQCQKMTPKLLTKLSQRQNGHVRDSGDAAGQAKPFEGGVTRRQGGPPSAVSSCALLGW
jgi:hypothetical protein